ENRVDAVALDGLSPQLQLGRERMRHIAADRLENASDRIPEVSGSGIRGAFERWAMRLVNEVEPGILTRRRVLFAPGLNHNGLVDGISAFTDNRRWAEPVFYFNLPSAVTG